jgi:WD40 repeat protein
MFGSMMNQIQTKIPTRYSNNAEVPLQWGVGDLVLDTYQVKEIFDSGAMAYVYRVHHRDWDIDLAVKSPKPGKLNLGGAVDLFVREAETWVNLGLYPHIVSCYYIRVLGGVPRIFMEYVDGGSLLDAIEDGSLYQGSSEEVLQRLLDIAVQFAWGLHYAHQKGLVHQDIKPANVLLTRDNIAKVTDFGMTQAKDKLLKRDESSERPVLSRDGDSVLVDTIGMTPAYCSPEQAATQPLSRRTDIWSWAVSVLEMFLGERDWTAGPAAAESLDKYIKERPTSTGKPGIPGSMLGLLQRCLSENPEDRPVDMRVVANNLQKIYRQEINQHYQRPEPRVKTTLADTLNNRGVSIADLGYDEDAIKLFDEALQAESTHRTAIYNRGLILWHNAEITDQNVMAELLDNQKNLADTSETVFLISLLHLERGDSERAAHILKEAIETYGNLPALKRIYNLAKQARKSSGRCLKIFVGHESPVNTVAINSDGDRIFSGSNDGTIKMWHVESGKCEKEFIGHDHLVQTVALSPDEIYLLSGSWDHTVRAWEIDSGECIYEFDGHTDVIQEVAFTPDGEWAVSASSDCTLRVWDLQTGEERQTLSGHFDTVSTFVISKDGKKLVSASFDNTLKVWDLDSGECEKTIEWVKSCTSNLALTTDGKSVLLAGADTRLWLVDLETGKIMRSFSGHEGTVKSLQIAPNGSWVLSGSTDRTLRLWDLKTTRCLRTYSGHELSLNAVAVCPKKVLAVTGSSDASVRLWWLSVGAKSPYITVLPRSSEEIIELTDQIEAQMKVASQKFKQGDYEGTLAILAEARANPGYQQNPRLLKYWDRVGRKGVRQGLRSSWLVHSYPSHLAGVNSVAFAGGGKIAVTGSDDSQVYIWDLGSGEVLRQLSGHEDEIRSVAISERVKRVVSGSADGTLRVWNLDSGKCLRVMSGHTQGINTVAMTLDGRLAVSGSNDNTLRLWSIATGKTLNVFSGHDHYVRCVALSPDMRLAFSASWDRSLRVWDLASRECLRVIEGHTEAIDALAISPDGGFALTGGLDHTLVLWNITTGEPVKVIEDVPGRILSVAFSVDRRFIFSGEMDGTVNIWRISEGKSVSKFIAHRGPVNCLDVSPDGRFLASVSADRLLNIWRLDWDYSYSPEVHVDTTARSYLNTFLAKHRPYPTDGVAPTGKPKWNRAEFNRLMRTLSYRGYGGVSPREVNAWLKKLAERVR